MSTELDLDALEREATRGLNAGLVPSRDCSIILALIAELRAWRELFPGETPEQAAEHYVS